MWTPQWLIKWVSELPTAAAQKEKYETQIMLLKAEHQKAIEKLEAENRELRAKVEPVVQENKQLHAAIGFLQSQLKWHEDMQASQENDNPAGL